MGYYQQISNSSCRIKISNLEEAHRIMCRLNFKKENKNGGRYSADINNDESVQPNKNQWFAWMDWNYHITCKDAEAIFHMLGFDYTVDDQWLWIDSYDSKTGAEEYFFASISHLIEDGFIEWVGEDNLAWRWSFEDSKMSYAEGRIVYDEAIPL